MLNCTVHTMLKKCCVNITLILTPLAEFQFMRSLITKLNVGIRCQVDFVTTQPNRFQYFVFFRVHSTFRCTINSVEESFHYTIVQLISIYKMYTYSWTQIMKTLFSFWIHVYVVFLDKRCDEITIYNNLKYR